MSDQSQLDFISHEIEGNNKDIKWAFFGILITSAIQLVVASIYWHNAYQDRKEQAIERQNDRILTILEHKYERQEKKYAEIEYPLVALRANIESISDICKSSQTLSSDDKKKIDNLIADRTKNKIALVQAYGGVQVIYDQETFNVIRNLVKKIETMEDDRNPCSPMVLDPEMWRQQENILDNLMIKLMEQTGNSMSYAIPTYYKK